MNLSGSCMDRGSPIYHSKSGKSTSGDSSFHPKGRKLSRVKFQKINNEKAVSLKRELRSYERAGTHLYLENRPSRAEEIVSACMFAEDSDYMRDFITDEQEHITEIHFIRITETEKDIY